MHEENPTPKWVRRLLPLVVLCIGAAATVVLLKVKKSPERKQPEDKGVLVEVMAVSPTSRQIRVVSQGTVRPQRQVNLSPQVPGKVTWVHDDLRVGGLIKGGTPIIKLDPVDYQLALEKARVQLVTAQKGLAETESNAAVAKREWKTLGEQTGQREANPLALFEPQLKLARANMRSAKAQIKQAKVNLSRTTIRAPFNLQVRSESVEQGQYVVVGQGLATVTGTDAAEVFVPLPLSELRWIELPRQSQGGDTRSAKRRRADKPPSASTVRVSMAVGGKRFERPGQLLRSVGEIEAEGRMTRLVVGIEDPYNLRRTDAEGFQPQFQLGAFVDVAIEGQRIDGVFPIPATALRLGSVVWVVGEGNLLALRKVTVARLTEQEALISAGLVAGDRVVLTSLSGAVNGTKLRIKAAANEDTTATATATP